MLDEATFEQALQRLPERRRLALRLRFKDQLIHAEIADVLETSVEAATMLVSRALKDLRAILEVLG